MSGGRIGSVEESFISRLKPGDRFLFGGRILEFVRVHELTAFVKRASGTRGAIARWQGAKMPMSNELAHAALEELRLADQGVFDGPEMRAIEPLIEIQQRWSALPTPPGEPAAAPGTHDRTEVVPAPSVEERNMPGVTVHAEPSKNTLPKRVPAKPPRRTPFAPSESCWPG